MVVELEELDGAIPDQVRRVNANAMEQKAAVPSVRAPVKQPKKPRWLPCARATTSLPLALLQQAQAQARGPVPSLHRVCG